jgi:hypothetical protein
VEGHAGLWQACLRMRVQQLSTSVSAGKLLDTGSGGGCLDLTRSATTLLFTALGDESANKHASLLIAARSCLLVAVALASCAAALTFAQTFSVYYHAAWATVPLTASIASMVLGILTCSFYSAATRGGFKAGGSDLWPGGGLDSGWVCALLFAVFVGLSVPSSIVDLVIPHRRPAGMPARGGAKAGGGGADAPGANESGAEALASRLDQAAKAGAAKGKGVDKGGAGMGVAAAGTVADGGGGGSSGGGSGGATQTTGGGSADTCASAPSCSGCRRGTGEPQLPSTSAEAEMRGPSMPTAGAAPPAQ